MGTHEQHLSEALLVVTTNVFYSEIRKIIPLHYAIRVNLKIVNKEDRLYEKPTLSCVPTAKYPNKQAYTDLPH